METVKALSTEGEIIDRMADHGDCDFPIPGPEERLCLISADPMPCGSRVLSAMAAAFPDLDIGEAFSDHDRADARHFLEKILEAGIGAERGSEPGPEV